MSLQEDTLTNHIYDVLVKAAVEIPEDVKAAFQDALTVEESEIAKEHLKMFLENIDSAVKRHVIVCPDTGFPIFYVKLGDGVEIEGGYSTLRKVFNRAVERATADGYLRVTMVHPLTRKSSAGNVGHFIPRIEYKPISANYMEVTAIPKGGGAELFLVQPFRSLLLADGLEGVKKFVLDSVISACLDGKSCPPNVVGVGIGGFSDLCMGLAKKAAVLRPIGDRHPDREIAKLEKELLSGINSTGVGAMGGGGGVTAFDVHIEHALTHTVGIPTAVNLHCALCRRATIRIYSDGSVEPRRVPDWFER
ncbi:MAG: fumarate hydratase [Nitrososphaeria archaeon]|nr:fumarate hydratase [Nitrososphaeria archaeon]NIQ33676.1 fumarate hydratase [Nitrososphaeria archaeon]